MCSPVYVLLVLLDKAGIRLQDTLKVAAEQPAGVSHHGIVQIGLYLSILAFIDTPIL